MDEKTVEQFWGYMRIASVAGCCVCVGFFVAFPLTNTDFWWHLAGAREMLAQGSFLRSDPFSFTLDHPSWINLHWLFQMITYAIFKMGGKCSLVIAKVLVVAFSCGLACLAIPRKRYAVVAGVVLTLFMYQARYLVLARPIVVTLLGISTYVFCLENFWASGRRKYLWWLLPMQVVWTNSQGLFALGPAIAFAYWLGDSIERVSGRLDDDDTPRWGVLDPGLTMLLVGSVLVCFINPYGLDGVLFPIKLFFRIDPTSVNVYSRQVSENVPLIMLRGAEMRYVITVIVGAVLGLVTFVGNKGNARLSHFFLFCGFLLLAFMAMRNVLPFVLVVSVILSYNLYGIWRDGAEWFWDLPSVVHLSVLATIGLAITHHVVSHSMVVSRYPTDTCVSPFRVPISAVTYLKKHPVSGKMFNSIRHGGYLIWNLYPEKQVFVDGRMVIRPVRFLAEYFAILDRPELFPKVAERFGITHAIIPTAIFPRYARILKWLYESDDWHLVMADGESALFLNSEVFDTEGIDLSTEEGIQAVFEHMRIRWPRDNHLRVETLYYVKQLCADLGAVEQLDLVEKEISREKIVQ